MALFGNEFIYFFVYAITFAQTLVICSEDNYNLDPDTYLPTNKIVQRHGYPCESKEVTTDDGYILTIHRIPHGKGKYGNANLPPVFFQHGLLGSSSDWIISGPQKSLAYELADRGHDVWIGNIRGNIYSRAHVSMSPDTTAFWNFTFHEMAVYDLPAMIDDVLRTTKQDKIYYIGHSMGTTMFYVLCSMKPEYNDKIIHMFSLAPVAFISHAKSPIRYLAPYAKDFEKISEWIGDGEFLPRNVIVNYFMKMTCELTVFEKKICEEYIFILCGYDPLQFNMTLLPVIIGHTPAGASSKTLTHYSQEIDSGKFRQFDYGTEGNRIMYKQDVPPDYNISLITAPISLHYADNDLLANIKDVIALAKSLPNLKFSYEVPFPKFNHLDFLWSKDVNPLVNDLIVSKINLVNIDGDIPVDEESLNTLINYEYDDEPVFNDVGSLLKHKVTRYGKKYVGDAMKIGKAAERKMHKYAEDTRNFFTGNLRRLRNYFTFNDTYDVKLVEGSDV